MKKRLLSILLAVYMVLTIAPAAFAADATVVENEKLTVTEDGSTVYYMITDADKKEVEVCSRYAPLLENPSDYTGEVNIPATIEVDEVTYSVTGVGNGTFESSTVTKVTLPNSIKYVGNAAFWKAGQLTEVILPEGLETISGAAFQECTSLVKLSIPSTVTEIGSNAFWQCKALTSLTIPVGVTEIKNQVFWGCESLSDLTILGPVTSIGKQAFVSCPASNLTIPETVTHIGTAAFLGCDAKSLTIPEGVTEGVADALLGYENVDKITFAGNSSYKIDNGVLYHGTVLEAVLDRNITTLTVLPGTTEIAAEVCAADSGMTSGVIVPACTELATVIIPESVTKIGTNAFNGALKNPGSTLIMMGETPPEIDQRLWTGGRNSNIPKPENLTVIIPVGSEEAYSNATAFQNYVASSDESETAKPGISYKMDINKTVSIVNGETENLGTAIVPSGWTLSIEPANDGIVTISTPDASTGAVTATANNVGSVTVKFSIKNDSGSIVLAEQSCTVTVEPAPVPVTNVALNTEAITLYQGESYDLTATVTPADATNKSVTWTGSDTSVATVDNGTVKAVGIGTATITVTTADGGKTASCVVTVQAPYVPIPPVTPVQPINPTPTPDPDPDPAPDPTPGVWSNPYTDVAVNDWYYNAVAYVSTNGLMTGTTASTFAPNDTMTRAMVWTVLARMEGQSVEGGSPWYALAQSWAMNAAVSDGTGPNDSITREQLVTMLYRQAGSPEVGVPELARLGQFSDGEAVSDWAQSAMAWAVANGILTGEAGALNPQAGATRGQVAAILMRFCQQ